MRHEVLCRWRIRVIEALTLVVNSEGLEHLERAMMKARADLVDQPCDNVLLLDIPILTLLTLRPLCLPE